MSWWFAIVQSANGANVDEFLGAQLADYECHWSIGTFGALAEFARDSEEAVTISRTGGDLSAITGRGGIRISPLREMRLVASEGVTRKNWSHRVALCLREARSAMARYTALTELGRDAEALRECDRESILFDLGLGALQVNACIRESNPTVVADLRKFTGRNVFEPGNPVMSIIVPASPHRVFLSRLGRIEVFQPIPPPDGRSPEGPHTHVLPKLLEHRRTHAATERVPDGLIPCAHLYPAHPKKDALGREIPFNSERHESFQKILSRFGDKHSVELKRRVVAAVDLGIEPTAFAVPDNRFARANVRVTLRQLQASREMSPTLETWLHSCDGPHSNLAEIDDAETEDADA